MKITKRQLEDLYLYERLEVNGKDLELVETGEWEQDHKFQSLEIIFTDGEKFYRGYIGRSGSYHSDWIYDSEVYGADEIEDVYEVEKREVTVTKWVTVE